MNTPCERPRLIAFDLDGTLTQHKSPLCDAHRAVLSALREKYALLMVGAGDCLRIRRQLGEFPIDIIGNYGLQAGEVAPDGSFRIVRDEHVSCDRASVEARVARLRERFGFTAYAGRSVEFHDSGVVTFAILGTDAALADKLAFDPDRSRRRAIYAEVCAAFPDFIVFIGGSSSFDMAPAPFDKAHALRAYAAARGFAPGEVLYVGDDYGPGGNDESVYLSEFPFLCIDRYTDFPAVMKPYL